MNHPHPWPTHLASLPRIDLPDPKPLAHSESPQLGYEQALWRAGFERVAGIDEAGRGALAGPVVAAAVVLPRHCPLEGVWTQVRDSKLLRPAVRTRLDGEIRAAAAGVGVGMATATEIDAMGIAPATRLAMLRSLDALSERANYLLIDWVRLAQCPLPQCSFAKADRISVSVAAASIVAKVARDALMVAAHGDYPAYGFDGHKGYGARTHLAALEAAGPCPLHRYSFAPLARRATLFGTSAQDGCDG